MDVLNDILDSLNDSIIILDPFGQIIFYNTEALHIQKSISNKPVEIGDQIPDVVSLEHRQGITDILKAVRSQKKIFAINAECNTHTGTKIFLELKFVPVLDEIGQIKFINIITVDITSRKVLESRARAAAVDISNLMEHAHALILTVDSQGYIVECNTHFAEVTGFHKNEIYCQKASEILVKRDHASLINELIQAVSKNKPVTNFRLPIQTKSGLEVIIMLGASPRMNIHGDVIGATWIGQDITELTIYRKALQEFFPVNTAGNMKEESLRMGAGSKAKNEVDRKIFYPASTAFGASGIFRMAIDFIQKVCPYELWPGKSTSISQNIPSGKAV